MKPISIKVQKLIAYTPWINVFCIPIWFYNSFVLDKENKTLLQALFILFSSLIPLVLLEKLVAYHFVTLGDVLHTVNLYLIPTIIGHRLIKLQENNQ